MLYLFFLELALSVVPEVIVPAFGLACVLPKLVRAMAYLLFVYLHPILNRATMQAREPVRAQPCREP
jgi:hypothetical protein